MKEENVVNPDPNAQPAPEPAPAPAPAPVPEPAPAPAPAPEPEFRPDGLPSDAVVLPGEEPAPVEPTPVGVDEETLTALEQKADEARGVGITTPGGATTEPTIEERMANVEGFLQQIATQQAPGQPTQPVQPNPAPAPAPEPAPATGAQGAYNEPYDPNDPYAQPAVPTPQTVEDSLLPTIQQELQQHKDWMGLLYQQQQDIEKKWQAREDQRSRDQQSELFRQRYNVDNDTVDRAAQLVADGDFLGAMTLVEGRSRAQEAGEAAREERAEARELAGTPTVPGNAMPAGVPTDLDAAKEALDAARAMPTGQARDLAFIKVRQDYPESSKMLMEQTIGGPLITDAQTTG